MRLPSSIRRRWKNSFKNAEHQEPPSQQTGVEGDRGRSLRRRGSGEDNDAPCAAGLRGKRGGRGESSLQADDVHESAKQEKKDEGEEEPHPPSSSPSPAVACQDGSATTPGATIGDDDDDEQRRQRHHRFFWRIDDYSIRDSSSISSMWRTSASSSPKSTTRTILRDIVGEACSGDFVAVLGPTGCGKTCLLDCLSLRTRHFTGALAMDGRPITPDFFRHTAYVSQVELFFSNLTVREHLTFHAINTSTNHHHGNVDCGDSIKARVDKAMDDVGLSKVADCLIGGGVFAMSKGLSGGERKRLSVATGLLGDPSVILLDEPTSGLDVVMAGRIVESLSRLASSSPSSLPLPSQEQQQQRGGGGRLVMASFHSPSSHMVSHAFTHLLLLTPRGRLAYYGLTSQLLPYLVGVGLYCPAHYNPADFLLEIVASSLPPSPSSAEAGRCQSTALPPSAEQQQVHGGDDASVSDGGGSAVVMLEEAWAAASPYKHHHRSDAHNLQQLLTNSSHQSLFRSVGGQSSLWTQFCTNLHRNWRQATREYTRIMAELVVGCVLMAGMGIIHYKKVHVAQHTALSILFCLSGARLNIVACGVVFRTPAEFQIILREYYSGSNSAVPYLAARCLSDLALCVPDLFKCMLPYFMVGLSTNPYAFAWYCATMAAVASAAQSLGLLASSLSNHPHAALSIVSTFLVITHLVCSFHIDSDDPMLGWLQAFSIQHHTLSCLAIIEARHVGGIFKTYSLAFLKVKVSDFLPSLVRVVMLGFLFRFLALAVLMVRMRIARAL